jgi:hypothetical protein
VHPELEKILAAPVPYLAFLQRYNRKGIHGKQSVTMFAREVMQFEPDVWQEETFDAYGDFERRLSIVSGHGVGKSAAEAIIICHHAITEFPQKTVITAPTSPQLFDVLWPEVNKWFGKLPDFIKALWDVKSESIELKANPDESFISARTSRPEVPEALAGVHCADGSVLLVGDEASGIAEAVFEAASGSMSGHEATTLLTGNPVRTSGLFFDTHNKPAVKKMWFTRQVSCLDSPRVSKDFIADMAARYGEESNAYRVRVLGLFPRSDLDTIIPYELVEAAKMRMILTNPKAPIYWGLDVARFGGDRNALAKRQGGRQLEKIRTWRDKDLMQTAAIVKQEYDATPVAERPVAIYVDSIGMGAGVADRLRQIGLPAFGINVSEAAAFGDTYLNLRAELWYKCKEWFQTLAVWIDPLDEDLCAELVRTRYKFSRGAKFQVESKDDMKKRGFDSPDVADAFILTFAGGAAELMGSNTGDWGWNSTIERNIMGIV